MASISLINIVAYYTAMHYSNEQQNTIMRAAAIDHIQRAHLTIEYSHRRDRVQDCPVEKLRRQEDHQVMGDGSQVHFAAAGLILS